MTNETVLKGIDGQELNLWEGQGVYVHKKRNPDGTLTDVQRRNGVDPEDGTWPFYGVVRSIEGTLVRVEETVGDKGTWIVDADMISDGDHTERNGGFKAGDRVLVDLNPESGEVPTNGIYGKDWPFFAKIKRIIPGTDKFDIEDEEGREWFVYRYMITHAEEAVEKEKEEVSPSKNVNPDGEKFTFKSGDNVRVYKYVREDGREDALEIPLEEWPFTAELVRISDDESVIVRPTYSPRNFAVRKEMLEPIGYVETPEGKRYLQAGDVIQDDGEFLILRISDASGYRTYNMLSLDGLGRFTRGLIKPTYVRSVSPGELGSLLETYYEERIRKTASAQQEWIERLTEAAHEKADRYDWCDEFDDFMEEFGLARRSSDYVVTVDVAVQVQLQVTATSEDEAEEMAADEVQDLYCTDIERAINDIGGIYGADVLDVEATGAEIQ